MTEIQKLTKEKKELENIIELLEDKNAELTDDINELEDTNKELYDDIEKLNMSDAELRKLINSKNTRIVEVEEREASLKLKAKELQKVNNRLSERNIHVEANNTELTDGNKRLHDKIAELEKEISDRQSASIDEATGLRLRIKELKNDNTKLTHNCDEYIKRNTELRNDLASSQAVIQSRDEDINALQAELDELRPQLGELTETAKNWQDTAEGHLKNLNDLQREFMILSGAVDGLLMVRQAQRNIGGQR